MNGQLNISKQNLVIEKRTNYRWIVLLVVFLCYLFNMADRSNVGAVLPFIKTEFHFSNFQAGAISSFFFLGYAITQIPAGFLLGKKGSRGIVSLAILGFSGITFLIGGAQTAGQLLMLRLGLGVTEGPAPVGMTSTINQWFPAKEKATATGVYIASTQLAPIIVPSIAVWISMNYGWRTVFHWFAIPGLLMAVIWFVVVRGKPEQSKSVSKAELSYIRQEESSVNKATNRSLGWIDKVIRYKEIESLDTNKKVFKSWNVWGNTLAYFCMNNVLYGMLTWIPSYLVVAKHYSFIKMGFVAAAPSIGGLVGALCGGWISDRIFLGRRKPTMLITALTTAIMMVLLIKTPQNVTLVGITLFMTGLCLNIGWPAFTAYLMNLTNRDTYPVSVAVVNSGGNLGGFFSPMIIGAVLDATGNYNLAFMYFVVVLVIAFFLILSLVEPAKIQPSASKQEAM